jgi:gamma-glutamyltranspeptidase / glutathione hydrolase
MYQRSFILAVSMLCCSFTTGLAYPVSPAGTRQGMQQGMVAADHPQAAHVGARILEQGGDAVDAAVATAFALGVVHPFASGIGGGGFAVVHRADGAQLVLDFREVAPKGATAGMFLDSKGAVVPGLSRLGALAAGVPGEVAGLYELHRRYGKLPWATVIAPAIKLAREGFVITEIMHYKMKAALYDLRSSAIGPFLMQSGEKVRTAGMTMRLPPLARSLERIAKHGAADFYTGALAQDLVKSIRMGGGLITLEDLANYTVKERAILKAEVLGYEILTMPPPSSGGLVLIQVLKVLASVDLRSLGHNSAQYIHHLVESFKHAFADRAKAMGDPDFVALDHNRFISPQAIEHIRKQFDRTKTHPSNRYGERVHSGSDGGTSHLSTLDQFGNAVALTTTVNTGFGSRFVAGKTGIILNNQMDDFVARPGVPNSFGLIGEKANAIEPNKRPLSSMSPTILLKSGQPVMVVGASGGPMIISATLQVMLNIIVFGMKPDAAVRAQRIHHQWMPNHIWLEPGISKQLRKALEGLGHTLKERKRFSAAQVITRTDGAVSGAADPSKGGSAELATP